MLGYDFFSGCGGASASWSRYGYNVLTFDNNFLFNPDYCVDLLTFDVSFLDVPRLAWFSFLCTEFARESMPWSKTGVLPDLSLFFASVRMRDNFISRAVSPFWWVFENVRGSVPYLSPYLGKPFNYGPYYLWSNLPLHKFSFRSIRKSSITSGRDDLRSLVPVKISSCVAMLSAYSVPLF